MGAFCESGHLFRSKAEHFSPFVLSSFSKEERHAARRRIRALPGGPQLEAMERHQLDSEPTSEPEIAPVVFGRM